MEKDDKSPTELCLALSNNLLDSIKKCLAENKTEIANSLLAEVKKINKVIEYLQLLA